MSITTTSDIQTSVPEKWALKVLRDHLVTGFWGTHVGSEGSGKPIIQATELLNKPGDLIHIQVSNPLTGSGVTEEQTLEGNEEDLTLTEIKVSPIYRRHGVRIKRRANKKSIVDLRAEGKMRLAEWGMQNQDQERFDNFAATVLPAPLASEAYTPNIFTVGGIDATPTVDDIIATEFLDVEAIQQIKLSLRLQRAKPVMVNGQPTYFCVSHPYATYQLKRDDEYRDYVKDARDRGKDNPLFVGAIAMIDGVVIYDHERVPLVTNAGSLQVAKGIAFGQEFAVEGLDENPDWDEDVFDYGDEFGFAYGFACQPRRALELSSVQVYSYAPTVGTVV